MTIETFRKVQNSIKGKTVAVVYIFEGENSKGFEHYDIWQSDVISEWLSAIQENGCHPLILDIRTFIQKAMDNSLPHIDFVVNLNAGNKVLSTLGLVPSVCSFLDIPCIPCNTVSIISGEHKGIANHIAKTTKLNLPGNNPSSEQSIFRPYNYGSSRGVIKGKVKDSNKDGIYQEFIKGYDITTPLLYNPLSERLEALPTVMYYSENKDINWFFNEEVKEKRGGYKKKIIQIDSLAESQYIELAKKLGINCYCRIDARIKCSSEAEWEKLCEAPIPASKIYFIEINPMPTLKKNINFHNSIDSINETHSFIELFNEYKSTHTNNTQTGLILLCSMLANI